ncbi:MAG TPA: DUF4271 domain-containing protein [Puia sp.]|nr:DUF4271 domain-containing protein [Puia sp.]
MSAFFRQDTYFCTSNPANVIKFSFLFFFCLFLFSQLSAQSDSTRPLNASVAPITTAQDTSVHTPEHPIRHDSASHRSRKDSLRRDSIARHRAALRRDSLRQVAVADSVRAAGTAITNPGAAPNPGTPAATSSANTSGDSIARRDSLLRIAAGSSPPLSVGFSDPFALSLWRKVLEANPWFNFLGQPVPDIYEIHRPNSKDSLFYLIVGILFYFALIRIFFEKYFNNLMTLFFRVSLRQQQIREQVLQTPLPSMLLNILYIISVGLYACFLLHYSRFGEEIYFWWLYLYCMMALSAIYLIKFLFLKFCGWVFSISRATDTYIFIVFLVNKMLGIFLLPFLILIIFSGNETREVFITISLAMFFVLWMYRVLAAYRPIRNEIKLTPFHFFLYLCAFEIAPLLLIYKVLLAYLEKVY